MKRFLFLLLLPVFAFAADDAKDEELRKQCEAEGGCVIVSRLMLAQKQQEAFMQGFLQGVNSVKCLKPNT